MDESVKVLHHVVLCTYRSWLCWDIVRVRRYWYWYWLLEQVLGHHLWHVLTSPAVSGVELGLAEKVKAPACGVEAVTEPVKLNVGLAGAAVLDPKLKGEPEGCSRSIG